ncbi:MAG: hypothetical protein A3E80_04675 [Chlamydiae bacterium RIFCSPHIGHO2_12_FULL_49_9]|nr:MAG: hypothetical protein A3E80_04675 [Chlamydiae bacterium RIFCSPHIGHO2_12_FULL_49_9]
MSLNETMGKLEALLASVAKDLGKVGRGNKAAAQRVRVGTIKLEKIAKQFRKESVAAERGGKLKKKKKKKR